MGMPPIKNKRARHYVFTVKRNGAIVKTHTLILNPEELSQDEPARAEVFKTLGGAYVEEWGRDIPVYTIQGTTGYRIQKDVQGKNKSGFESFKELRNDIYRFYLEPGGEPKQVVDDVNEYTLEFNNFEDAEHYIIVPQRFSLQRSKNQPLLYSYVFSFYCVREIGGRKNTQGYVEKSLFGIQTLMNSSGNNIRIGLNVL